MSDLETPTSPSTGEPEAQAPAEKASPRLLDDKVVRRLIFACLAIVALWLATVVSALVLGLLSPEAPRTYAEKELYLLADATKAAPKDGRLWARYASILVETKQYAQAEVQIEAGLRNANADRALILLADARLSAARDDDAEALKKADLTLKEADKEIKAKLADYKKRVPDLNDPQVESPALEGAYLLKANIYAEQKKWQDAVDAYTKYLEKKPNAADVIASRGEAYLALGDEKKAEEDFRAALKFVPDMKSALEGLKTMGVSE